MLSRLGSPPPESSSWSISLGKSARSHAAATRPPAASTPTGMTMPRHLCAALPMSRTTSLRDRQPLTERYCCSHSGNACHALPRAISTAAPPFGSHKRTKAKSRYSELTNTSASPAAMAGGSLPTHTAGTVESATRSRRAVRSRRASASRPIGTGRDHCALCVPASLPDFEEELVRRNKVWIFLQYPPDNHDRVSPHHVHHHAGTELRQIVGADHRIVVFWIPRN